MSTKPVTSPGIPWGDEAYWLGQPIADTPQGGIEHSVRGVTVGEVAGFQPETTQQPREQFQGMGPWLEAKDGTVYQSMDGLVLRQELTARNHLAQDTHWTLVKLGFPFSTLTKDQTRDTYEQTMPYGSDAVTIQAVPNKSWDLVNKTTQMLLQDFPQAEAEPQTDSEQAQAACQMANRFLAEDATEAGTNDAVLFHDRVERSLTCASSYIEYWIDPVGGGYIPLQILAHPQATDPAHPLIGPDGMPTNSPIERYVTRTGPNGEPPQFTDDPDQADAQWQPKIRASKWEREHVRVFPESATVNTAEKIIILGYCTLGEAKRRWRSVAAMSPDELSVLCDWTPARYLPLLPPFQRARWKLTDGRDKEKAGASDERIMFYYHGYAKASPDYLRGCSVVCTGARGGFVIDRALLAKPIEVETSKGPRTDIRCMEIPVVQVTPRGDPDTLDPTGRAYIELFAGAAQANAYMASSFATLIDLNLHPDKYIPATSPVQPWEVQDARETGGYVLITSPADKPIINEQPQLPHAFFNMYELSDEAINSIASSERAATGQDNSAERSGKAIQLATANNNISLSGMNTAVNNAYARACRIKIELAMLHYTTQQQIQYVGEDGSYKQDEWSGVDFAQVGRVTIKAGSGTMMTPDAKVQYLGGLVQGGMLDLEEAKDAARESYTQRLGIAPNPSSQRVERQVAAWLKGPPAPQIDPATGQPGETWEAYAARYSQAKTVADQQTAQQTQSYQVLAQQAQSVGVQPPAPPQPIQPIDPMTGQPMAPPWTPFDQLPQDSEPQIAALRQRRLQRLQDTAQFMAQPPLWRQQASDAYAIARNAVSAAQAPPPQAEPAPPRPE